MAQQATIEELEKHTERCVIDVARRVRATVRPRTEYEQGAGVDECEADAVGRQAQLVALAACLSDEVHDAAVCPSRLVGGRRCSSRAAPQADQQAVHASGWRSQ